MLNKYARAFFSAIFRPIAQLLLRLGISPDVVTIVGTVGVAFGALWFYPRGDFLVGTLFITVFVFSDMLDGNMARLSGRSSTWGAYLDSTLDRIADSAVFIGLAFSAVGMFATTFMRSWVDFDWIMLVIQPLFLLSATFFPLGTYPGWAQPIVQATPLYHGVALERGLMLGEVGWGLLWHVGYLVVLGVVGIWATSRRIETLLRS